MSFIFTPTQAQYNLAYSLYSKHLTEYAVNKSVAVIRTAPMEGQLPGPADIGMIEATRLISEGYTVGTIPPVTSNLYEPLLKQALCLMNFEVIEIHKGSGYIERRLYESNLVVKFIIKLLASKASSSTISNSTFNKIPMIDKANAIIKLAEEIKLL